MKIIPLAVVAASVVATFFVSGAALRLAYEKGVIESEAAVVVMPLVSAAIPLLLYAVNVILMRKIHPTHSTWLLFFLGLLFAFGLIVCDGFDLPDIVGVASTFSGLIFFLLGSLMWFRKTEPKPGN